MRDLKQLIPRKQREERQIEFVTNQHCNFRCFGCDSFSDIIKSPNFDNLVKEDIVNWSKVLVPLSNQSLINCKKVKFIFDCFFIFVLSFFIIFLSEIEIILFL